MSKYIIEQEVDEVKFKKVHLNINEYGETLVELSAEQLDQERDKYSKQGLYTSVYYQEETKEGIKFFRSRETVDVWEGTPKYRTKPWEPIERKDISVPYQIMVGLWEIDIVDLNADKRIVVDESLKIKPYWLTEIELTDKIRDFIKDGFKVNFGDYEYKWKKWRFIPKNTVKEITDDGEILYC